MSAHPHIAALLMGFCVMLPCSTRAESLTSAENIARKEAAERAERLAVFIVLGFDKIATMEHEALRGQLVSTSGNIVQRGIPPLLKQGGTVAFRLYLTPQDQTKLQSQPKGTVTAFVYGSIRQILSKDRIIEINVSEVTFQEPWGPFLNL